MHARKIQVGHAIALAPGTFYVPAIFAATTWPFAGQHAPAIFLLDRGVMEIKGLCVKSVGIGPVTTGREIPVQENCAPVPFQLASSGSADGKVSLRQRVGHKKTCGSVILTAGGVAGTVCQPVITLDTAVITAAIRPMSRSCSTE